MGRQAEKLLGIRNWAATLDDADKEHMPEEIKNLTGMYVELMDSLIMFVRVMGDMTNIRRKMFRADLLEPYKSLLEDDKNPPSPDWLAGEDVHGAIRKAKANASIADDLGRKNKWPKKPFHFNRNSGTNKPYDHNKRKSFGNDNGGYNKQNSGRKAEGYKQQGDNRGHQQGFRRRDSR